MSGTTIAGTNAYEVQPMVAKSLLDGESVVAWTGVSATGGQDVYFQLYDSSGTPVGSPVDVTNNVATSHQSTLISVAMNNEGQMVLLWDTTPYNSDLECIKPYYERFSSVDGSALDGPVWCDSDQGYEPGPGVGDPGPAVSEPVEDGPLPHRAYAIAIDDEDNIVVLTTDTVMGLPYDGLYVHTYNASDGLTGQWLETDSGEQVSLAMDSETGEFAISWVEVVYPLDLTPPIHMQAFSDTDTPSDTVTVNSTGEVYSALSTAINNSGEIVMGWLGTTDGPSVTTYSIHEEDFTYDGTTLSATASGIATVASVTSDVGLLGYTTIAMNDSGNYIVGFAYFSVDEQTWTFNDEFASYGTAPLEITPNDTGNAVFGSTISAVNMINMDHYLAIDDSGHAIWAYLIYSSPSVPGSPGTPGLPGMPSSPGTMGSTGLTVSVTFT
jgi:hypothetical protein